MPKPTLQRFEGMAEEIQAVLFDSNVFIDLVKYGGKSEKPEDASRAAHVEAAELMLRAAREGHLTIMASALCISECRGTRDTPQSPMVASDEVKRLLDGLLLSGVSGVTLRQMDPLLLRRARDLTWIDGLSICGADAIHLATCLKSGCAAVITFDSKIAKATNKPKLKKLGIRISKAQDALDLLPDSYRQGEFSETKRATEFIAAPKAKPKTRARNRRVR
jgi:predicted nucleic acid-binding protein